MVLGRPVTIRESDFDTYLPDAMDVCHSLPVACPSTSSIQVEEMDIWTHHPSQSVGGFFAPVPGRFLSCFNQNVSLCKPLIIAMFSRRLWYRVAIIIGRILEGLYGVRGDGLSTEDIPL